MVRAGFRWSRGSGTDGDPYHVGLGFPLEGDGLYPADPMAFSPHSSQNICDRPYQVVLPSNLS